MSGQYGRGKSGGYTQWNIPGGSYSYWIGDTDWDDEQPGSRTGEQPGSRSGGQPGSRSPGHIFYLEVGLPTDDADTLRIKLINTQMVLDSSHLQYEMLRTNGGTGYVVAISYEAPADLSRLVGITDSLLAVYGGRTSHTNAGGK
jgi:hypothetical protein